MTPVLWLDPVAACAVANDCTRFGGQVAVIATDRGADRPTTYHRETL